MNNRENRMNILEANGVDTSKYFTVKIPEGVKAGSTMTICFNVNGEPVVNNNDTIINEIIADGYVKNSKLHRRFVMAQMFKALNYSNRYTFEHGFAGYVRDKGYKYSINMMIEEVRVLSKLEERDEETFNERSSFFTGDVVVAILEHYMESLEKYIDGLKTYKCKGVPYKKIKNKNIFVDDLSKNIYRPMYNIIRLIKLSTLTCNKLSYKYIYSKLLDFKKIMIHLPHNTEISPVFMDTYKGEGAYYTLKNMVMFHGCKIYDDYEGTAAVKELNEKLVEYKGCGWKMMGLLRKTIEDNNFDWKERLAEIYS